MKAQGWLAAERQDLRDIAALWLVLARDPVPLTQEGEIKANSKRRLLACLTAVEYPDPNETLTQRRLDLALGRLRDSRSLDLHVDEPKPHERKLKLVAAGDLPAALDEDAASFQRSPDKYRCDDNAVICARTLGQALAGQSVGLVSFAEALQRLLKDATTWFNSLKQTPSEVALELLLPGWLHGELEIGLSRGKAVAIRFAAQRRKRTQDARAVADHVRNSLQAAGKDQPRDEPPDELDLYELGSAGRKCYPRRPHDLIGKFRVMDEDREDLTLTSAIDASV